MKLTTKLTTAGFCALVFVFVLCCVPPSVSQTLGTCSHGECSPQYGCKCPACNDANYYPGFCAGIGCESGFPCCPLHSCGDCYCQSCNPPSYCLASGYGCTADGCPFAPSKVDKSEADNHIQPWMADRTFPSQLAKYSKTWPALIGALQRALADTDTPLAKRRKLLLPNITHAEFYLPEYQNSAVVETKYNAQKGIWVFRLVRGLPDDATKGDILVITSQKWTLHNEASGDHIGEGTIAPMPNVLDLPTDNSVEMRSTAK